MTLRIFPFRPASPQPVTWGAVHVRSRENLHRVMGTIVLAALPCALFGAYNTGYQANSALLRLGADAPASWRLDLLAGLGIPQAPENIPACFAHGLLYLLPALALAWLAGALCEGLFSRARSRPRIPGLLPTALLFTLLLPPATPLWQVAIGMVFGTVIAKELFGGTGMGFVCAPAAAAAFLALAWPDTLIGDPLWSGLRGHAGVIVFNDVAGSGVDGLAQAGITWSDAFLGRIQGRMGTTSTLACALGAVLLLTRGIASWRVLLGVLLGALAGTLLLHPGSATPNPVGELGWNWQVVLGAFAFGAVFLAPDLNAGPATDLGRWGLGLVVGFLIILIRIANPLHPDGVVFAVLCANVCAPLLDSVAVWWHAYRRRRRHAR
jgi:Na+-transporting NADH:ubiquinone oxidoreductase subunit B